MSGPVEPHLTSNALHTLKRRYLRRDPSGRIVETPRELFERVSRVVAGAERAFGAPDAEIEAVAREFYDVMARGIFLPNSPTLMNAGRTLGVLSACFVLPVEDSIEGIFESVKQAAQIQKAGGGTGFSFDRLRPTGDYIASSGGSTSGPISFWRVFCEATRAIQQGALRRGANMGMLSVEHPDILKFVTAKNTPGAFENFNISVKVPDAFMASLSAAGDDPHVVINPRTLRAYWLPRGLELESYTLADLLPAEGGGERDVHTRRDVWELITRGAWATGEPGVCFIDRVNAANPTPHLGRIEATNPCGEQPLLDHEACNLGSIDLAKFVRGDRVDEAAFRRTVRLAVRFLDNVVEVNNYVTPAIEERCRGNRKIGLGIMGLADAMFELGIRYDSEEGMAFGRRIASLLTEEAFAASERLAELRGVFANHAGSTWGSLGRKMRNAAVTTIAPTGTLSILAGTSGGIEPVFALAFYRHVLDGEEMLEVNGPFRRLAERRGLWSEELARRLAAGEPLRDVQGVDEALAARFVTAHEIAPDWHVRMQAAFQELIDGAISKTINLPSGASPGDVDRVYRLAYELGCKGVTVYRDGCRAGQPMALGPAVSACPQCRSPIADESGCSRCPHCGATLCS
jgi:ribonucleoside-diphosphate reductase alpha chain